MMNNNLPPKTYAPNLNDLQYMSHLQRRIVIHSFLYYKLGDSVITDREYDAMSKELVAYKNVYPNLWKETMYYEQFGDDWNGATGFDLWDRLTDYQKRIILQIACAAPNGVGQRLKNALRKGELQQS